jgi:hypothetical protein
MEYFTENSRMILYGPFFVIYFQNALVVCSSNNVEMYNYKNHTMFDLKKK